ncbi:phosphopantetheine-binding protein [Actinophytocola sediminis]
MAEDYKPVIRAFLAETFPDEQIDDDDDLRAAGLVDSLLIVQLASLIERATGVQPADEDLEIEQLSVSVIAALMRQIGGAGRVLDGRR